MRESIINNACMFLLKKQFTLKILTRSCFDVVARKAEQILFLKVIEDASSLNSNVADEMKKVASYFNASPLIIADKTGSLLQDNVVYSRFDVYCLNLNTFKNCIENKFPFVKRSKAGLVAKLEGDRLKEMREKQGLSLNSIAKRIGVSPRMIVKYEQGISEVTFNRALKIYDLFGGIVFSKIDIFSNNFIFNTPGKMTDVEKKYSSLGFEVSYTRKVPFDIIAKKEDEVILTEVGDKVNPQFQSLGKIIDADNLVIFDKKKPRDIPAITKKEFLDFEEASELIKFLKEF